MDEYLSVKQNNGSGSKPGCATNGVWIVGGVAVGARGPCRLELVAGPAERLALEASAKYEQMLEALGARTRSRAPRRSSPSSSATSRLAVRRSGASASTRASPSTRASSTRPTSMLRSVMERTKDRAARADRAPAPRTRAARAEQAGRRPQDPHRAQPGAFAARFHEVRGDVLFAKGDKAGALKEYQARARTAPTQSVDSQVARAEDQRPQGRGRRHLPRPRRPTERNEHAPNRRSSWPSRCWCPRWPRAPRKTRKSIRRRSSRISRPRLRVQRAWDAGVGGDGETLRLGLGVAVEKGRVYAAGREGDVAAFDLRIGQAASGARARRRRSRAARARAMGSSSWARAKVRSSR